MTWIGKVIAHFKALSVWFWPYTTYNSDLESYFSYRIGDQFTMSVNRLEEK